MQCRCRERKTMFYRIPCNVVTCEHSLRSFFFFFFLSECLCGRGIIRSYVPIPTRKLHTTCDRTPQRNVVRNQLWILVRSRSQLRDPSHDYSCSSNAFRNDVAWTGVILYRLFLFVLTLHSEAVNTRSKLRKALRQQRTGQMWSSLTPRGSAWPDFFEYWCF